MDSLDLVRVTRHELETTCLFHVGRDSIICDMPHSYVTCKNVYQMDSLNLVRAMKLVLEMTCLIDMGRDSFVCDMSSSYVTYLV